MLDRFAKDSTYLFSIKTGLAVDPLIDQKYIKWVYVDRNFTKASIVLEGNSWDATGQLMIWTELPDDQFGGMTVAVLICNLLTPRSHQWRIIRNTCFSLVDNIHCFSYGQKPSDTSLLCCKVLDWDVIVVIKTTENTLTAHAGQQLGGVHK